MVVFGVMCLVIIILSAVLIFRKPEEVIITGKEQILKDSIALLQTNLDSSVSRETRLQKSYDSLMTLDPIIINRTRDKVQFILTDATPDELDSVIRTAWKTKSRYR